LYRIEFLLFFPTELIVFYKTDFDEYDFGTELLNYGTNESLFSGLFDSSYFEKVFHKLADRELITFIPYLR